MSTDLFPVSSREEEAMLTRVIEGWATRSQLQRAICLLVVRGVKTPEDVASRVEVVRRRDAFERDPVPFRTAWQVEEDKMRKRIVAARKGLNSVAVPEAELKRAAELCIGVGTDGLRGELTLIRAARALAAFEKAKSVGARHLRRVAPPALRHRLRRNPLDEGGSTVRIERALQELLGA